MKRLIYDGRDNKLILKNLSSQKVLEEQGDETVLQFFHRLEERRDRIFEIDLQDNLLLGKQMLEDNVYRGVVLEGIPATYAQTLEIINNIPRDSGLKPSEINEIISLKRAWDYILDIENLNDFSGEIDLEALYRLHSIIGANMTTLNPNQIGKMRKTPIFVGGVKKHDFGIPDPDEISNELSELSKITDPVLKALEIFLYISKKQMFRDGNKRTAILTANWLLIKNQSGLLTIKENLVPDFKLLLIDWYDNGNKQDLFNFFLNKCYIYNLVGKAYLD